MRHTRVSRNPDCGPQLGQGSPSEQQFFGFGAIAFVSMFANGFVALSAYIESLETLLELPPADTAIRPTGGQARLDAAVDLFTAFKVKQILVGGAYPSVGSATLHLVTNGDSMLSTCSCMSIIPRWAHMELSSEAQPEWTPTKPHRMNPVANNGRMQCLDLECSRLVSGKAEVTSYPAMNMPFSLSGAASELHTSRVLATEYAKLSAALPRGAFSDAIGDGRLDEASGLTAPSLHPSPPFFPSLC